MGEPQLEAKERFQGIEMFQEARPLPGTPAHCERVQLWNACRRGLHFGAGGVPPIFLHPAQSASIGAQGTEAFLLHRK